MTLGFDSLHGDVRNKSHVTLNLVVVQWKSPREIRIFLFSPIHFRLYYKITIKRHFFLLRFSFLEGCYTQFPDLSIHENIKHSLHLWYKYRFISHSTRVFSDACISGPFTRNVRVQTMRIITRSRWMGQTSLLLWKCHNFSARADRTVREPRTDSICDNEGVPLRFLWERQYMYAFGRYRLVIENISESRNYLRQAFPYQLILQFPFCNFSIFTLCSIVASFNDGVSSVASSAANFQENTEIRRG